MRATKHRTKRAYQSVKSKKNYKEEETDRVGTYRDCHSTFRNLLLLNFRKSTTPPLRYSATSPAHFHYKKEKNNQQNPMDRDDDIRTENVDPTG